MIKYNLPWVPEEFCGLCMVKTLKTCALYHLFVSSSVVSGGIIVFLCFILYDVNGERFTPHTSQYCSKVQKKALLVNKSLHSL